MSNSFFDSPTLNNLNDSLNDSNLNLPNAAEVLASSTPRDRLTLPADFVYGQLRPQNLQSTSGAQSTSTPTRPHQSRFPRPPSSNIVRTGTGLVYNGARRKIVITSNTPNYRFYNNQQQHQQQQSTFQHHRPYRHRFNMAQPTFNVLDAAIHDIGPCPYTDAHLDACKSAHTTLLHQHLTACIQAYDSYDALKYQILTLESQTDVGRTAVQTAHITALRSQIHRLYDRIEKLQHEITKIQDVQTKLKPALEIPPCGNADTMAFADMKEFMSSTMKHDDKSSTLKETWKKLFHYATAKGLTHDHFKLALISCTSGDMMEFAMEHQAKPLSEFASLIANRFITESSPQDAQHKFENFARQLDEPIRKAAGRLQTQVDKYLKIYPVDQRPALREFLLVRKLKELVSNKTKKFLDTKQSDSIAQGIHLTLKQLIELAHEDELRYGMPKDTINTPLKLFNTEVEYQNTLSRIDSKVDTLANVVNQLSLVTHGTSDDIGVNVMTRTGYSASGSTVHPPMTQHRRSSRPRTSSNNPSTGPRTYSSRSRDNSSGSAPPRRSDTPRPAEASTSTASASRYDRSPSTNTRYDRNSRPATRYDRNDRNDSSGTSNYDRTTRSRSRSYDQRNRYPSYNRGYVEHRSDRSDRPSRDKFSPRDRSRSVSPATYYRGKAKQYEHSLRYASKQPGIKSVNWDPSLDSEDEDEFLLHKMRQARKRFQTSARTMTGDVAMSSNARKQYTPGSTDKMDTTTTGALCSLCKSPIQHDYKDCYMVQTVLKTINSPENN